MKKIHDAPRVIALDIETAPMEVYAWRCGKQVVTIDHIKTGTSILSYSWCEWKRGKKVKARFDSTFSQADQRNDRLLLERLHAILSSATHVIAHNGIRFDLPMIRWRMHEQGLPQLPPIRVIDTMWLSKHIGTPESRKLAWLTRHQSTSKSSHGKFPGMELWKEYLARNPQAEREMRIYNNRDVESMCELLDSVLPYARGQMIAGLVPQSIGREEETPVCPKCGGDVSPRGFYTTTAGRYQRYRCNDCGGWSRSRFLVKEKRKHLLSPV